MKIKCLNGDSFRGQVGTPLPEGIVFQVTDGRGQPLKDKLVTITADPPGSVSFGADPQTVLKTKEEGIVAVSPTPRSFGPRTITASVAGEDREVTCDVTLEGSHPDVEVRNMNGRIVAIRRQQPPQPFDMRPIAAMVIAALVIGGALLLFGRDGGKTQPPIVVRPGPSSTVDATARAEAQAARAAMEAKAAELRGELDIGLASTTHQLQGEFRERDRFIQRQVSLRDALENARRIAEGRGDLTADGRSTICARDLQLRNHPACRE